MISDVALRETLRHNPSNAVTVVVERVTDSAGATLVRKELRRPNARSEAAAESGDSWAASTDPGHWNYWRREAEAYQSPGLRDSLTAAGLDLPTAEVAEHEAGITLWLEDVAGPPGIEFSLADHAALAGALGRWQAQGPLRAPWTSHRFLRQYSGKWPVQWQLMDDDAVWQLPLIRDNWPAELAEGWRRLLRHRADLLDVMERLPRTRSHLDLWVSNEIRRPSGQVVLLDWAFAGDGAMGEDLGNYLPDAVLDLFWPIDRLAELDTICFEEYVRGVRAAGWRGADRDLRLGVVASCVKYVWLLPLMLQQAAATEHRAYHQPVDASQLYRDRGQALTHLVSWCDEAVRLLAK